VWYGVWVGKTKYDIYDDLSFVNFLTIFSMPKVNITFAKLAFG